MHKHALLFLAAGLLVAAEAKDDAVKKELGKLAGTWQMVAGEKDGAKIPDEHVKKSRITWTGKEVRVDTPHQAKETIKATSTLNPGKKPKEMDWVRASGPGTGQTMHAIYEFVGPDEYRICFAPPGKERPHEFATKPGTGHTLHVWKRVKD